MYQIDNASAATVQPARAAPGPNPGGFFTGGNPATNTPATQVDADWLDMVQNELAAVLSAAGVAQEKANDAQLLSSIQAIVLGSTSATYVDDSSVTANEVVITLAPAITTYKDGQLVAGRIANSVTAPATLNAGAGAVSFISPAGPFQGGELPAGSEFTARYVAASNEFVLLNSTAGNTAVNAATESNHAVNLGQFETKARYAATQSGSIGISAYTVYSVSQVAITFPAHAKSGAFRVLARLNSQFSSTAAGINQNFLNSLYDGTNTTGGAFWYTYLPNAGLGAGCGDTILSAATYAPGSTVTFTQRVTTSGGQTAFNIANSSMEIYVVEA